MKWTIAIVMATIMVLIFFPSESDSQLDFTFYDELTKIQAISSIIVDSAGGSTEYILVYNPETGEWEYQEAGKPPTDTTGHPDPTTAYFPLLDHRMKGYVMMSNPDASVIKKGTAPPNSGYSGHEGTDIAGRLDTSGTRFPEDDSETIHAVKAGMIVNIVRTDTNRYPTSKNPYGVHIVLAHTDGTYTYYAHMYSGSIPSSLDLGTMVKAGDVLGKMGNTGNSHGKHLHFGTKDSKLGETIKLESSKAADIFAARGIDMHNTYLKSLNLPSDTGIKVYPIESLPPEEVPPEVWRQWTGKYPDGYDPGQPGPIRSNAGGKKIVIDAGHGGKDSGAVSKDIEEKTVREKDKTLEFAREVERQLKDAGYDVMMTRYDDNYNKSGSQRSQDPRIINFAPDVLLSFHFDSAGDNKGPKGTTVFHSQWRKQQDAELGALIHTNITAAMGTTQRGSVPDDDGKCQYAKQGGYGIINMPNMRDAIPHRFLIEIEFLSNPNAMYSLDKGQGKQKLAKGIVKSMDEFFKK